jgi:hypothetical protein
MAKSEENTQRIADLIQERTFIPKPGNTTQPKAPRRTTDEAPLPPSKND